MHQLDGVAEQDQALGVMIVQRSNEPIHDRGQAQDVAPASIAEMQIGDDERAHGGAR